MAVKYQGPVPPEQPDVYFGREIERDVHIISSSGPVHTEEDWLLEGLRRADTRYQRERSTREVLIRKLLERGVSTRRIARHCSLSAVSIHNRKAGGNS